MSAILSFVLGLVGKLFGGFLTRKQANMTEIADSNARAQERLAEKEAENELVEKAADVRKRATDRVVRDISEGSIDDNPAGYWRD